MFRFFKTVPITRLSVADAHARSGSGQILLVDVREAGEWAQMHIPGALHAPLSELAERLPKLPADRPIVFYCHSGNRSRTAVAVSRKLGLPHETDMAGGMNAWRAAGYPVEA